MPECLTELTLSYDARDLVCHIALNLDNAIDGISNWLNWSSAAPDLRWIFDASLKPIANHVIGWP